LITNVSRQIIVDHQKTINAEADTLQEILDNTEVLAGKLVLCKEDKSLVFVDTEGTVMMTDAFCREVTP